MKAATDLVSSNTAHQPEQQHPRRSSKTSSSTFFSNPYRTNESHHVTGRKENTPSEDISDSDMSDSTLLEKNTGNGGGGGGSGSRKESTKTAIGSPKSEKMMLDDDNDDHLERGLPLHSSHGQASSYATNPTLSFAQILTKTRLAIANLSSSSSSIATRDVKRYIALLGRKGLGLVGIVVVMLLLWMVKNGGFGDGLGGETGLLGKTSSNPARPSFKGWYLPTLKPITSHSPLTRTEPKREIDLSSESLPVSATLDERLLAWERSPGGRGPGQHLGLDGEIHEEVELGGFQAWNLESCSGVEPQMNTHMVQKSAQVWSSFNRTTLWETRMGMIDHMRKVQKDGLLDENKMGHGRGIVMVAGNADTMQRVIWSTEYMRMKGCELPVQVYLFPEEEPSSDDSIRETFDKLNIEIVVAKGQAKDVGKTKSYHLKALAVVQSPFQEVLYLDSDNIPVRDPTYMFDAPSYKRLGFWSTPDYWKTSGNNAIWSILGVRCRDEWEMEAGQIFVDKRKHLDTFLLIQFMLEHHEYFFWFSDGDKDIFRWALLALRKRWGVPGRWVAAAALPGATASGNFCGHTMLQFDAWGSPLFIHYNLLKQIPSGVGRGFTWGKHKQMPLFNAFPPERKHAHKNELKVSDRDLELRGLGDVDCDMLADADDEGFARGEAREEIRRRAARERGVKAGYHGGWISALCIDLSYDDPRPELIREASDALDKSFELTLEGLSDEEKDQAREIRINEKQEENALNGIGTEPDWKDSPLETIWWRDVDDLRDFEKEMYDMGFKPNGPGF